MTTLARVLLSAAVAINLAACMSRSSTSSSSPKRFVITDYGAVGDGKTLNTQRVQSLIDTVSRQGGGVVVVPAGSFLTGPLFFKQGVNLFIEKGATLLASTTVADYPQIPTRWEGVERVWTSAFLNFDHMTNVSVSGEGTIDGQGDVWMQRSPRFRGARGSGTRPATVPAGTQPSTRPAQRGRPRLICFSNCEHVRISDLHLLKQPVWCLHILYSDDVVVEKVHIDAVARIPSSDGIDVDSSRNVRISRCDIACNDDNISIKSGKDDDGRRVNRPSENVIISDCALGVGAGIAMGSEITGSVRHVLVERCTFTGTDAAARFKSQPSRGGTVEDITFRDITLNNVRFPFEFNLQWRMVPPVQPPAKILSVVRDIHFVRFKGTRAAAAQFLACRAVRFAMLLLKTAPSPHRRACA